MSAIDCDRIFQKSLTHLEKITKMVKFFFFVTVEKLETSRVLKIIFYKIFYLLVFFLLDHCFYFVLWQNFRLVVDEKIGGCQK